MRETRPHVFLIGETRLDTKGLVAFLDHVKARDWEPPPCSDVELLPMIEGKLCYNAFIPGNNLNVTRVRDDHEEYLANILKQRHGSVLEHSTANFIFCDVSRVFTHELVRHRVGVAISQESLRYVLLDDIGFATPVDLLPEGTPAHLLATWNQAFFLSVVEAEEKVRELTHIAAEAEWWSRNPGAARASQPQSDEAWLAYWQGLPFEAKKKYTSAIRRAAPMGLSTNIGWSANMRTLRHVLELRTDRSAEMEIRMVFSEVGRIALKRWPALFQDFKVLPDTHGGPDIYRPTYSRI